VSVWDLSRGSAFSPSVGSRDSRRRASTIGSQNSDSVMGGDVTSTPRLARLKMPPAVGKIVGLASALLPQVRPGNYL
jgi:hypothetical protein